MRNKQGIFFRELLFKHYKAIDEKLGEYQMRDSRDLVRMAFSQINAFDEFVRSAEGVPRDAINILSLAAQQSKGEKISINHVRKAARAWYQRDKEVAVRANKDAYDLLHWIIDKVIGERRARAFLLRSNQSDALVDFLYDAPTCSYPQSQYFGPRSTRDSIRRVQDGLRIVR